MSFAGIKYNIILNLKNIPAPSVNRKIVIIESDDYGGIRMPSTEAYKRMVAAGVHVDPSRYNTLDTLEDKDDLAALFETLTSVKDKNGRHAVITPFVNVANPDFEKIKTGGYKEYFYEPFTTTLIKYGRGEQTMQTWRQGMNENIFVPEYHGREHISVQPWLEKLQQGNIQLLHAFSYGFVAVGDIEGIHPYAQEFRPEFYFTNNSQKSFLHRGITEGIALFEKIFNYTPSSFTPSNSVFHPDFEETVYKAGVPFLNVAHKNPVPSLNGILEYHTYTNKQKIKKGSLNYYIRNCAFEPADNNYKSPALTLRQIDAAFRFGKAAIISTHRVNFTGGLKKDNRDKGLEQLSSLLKEIMKRWPHVEFMSTKDYVNLLLKKG
jgi:hypothetical protein